MNNFTLAHSLSYSFKPNASNIDVRKVYYTPLVIWVIILLLVNLLGAAGNGVTFAATILYRPLRQSTSCILLAHCLLIDLFITLFPQAGSVIIIYFPRANIPPHLCRGWGAVIFLSFYANNWAHTVLAINRFIAAVFPHHYKIFSSRGMLILAVAFPWFASLALNILLILEIHLRFEVEASLWMGCFPAPLGLPQYVITGLGIYIPCAVIGLVYGTVLIKARLGMRRRKVHVENGLRPGVRAQRYKVSKMLFTCFIWYCISNFAIPIAATRFPGQFFGNPVLQLSLKGLRFVSSAVNPVFFIAVSKNYRQGVIAVMTCRLGIAPSGSTRVIGVGTAISTKESTHPTKSGTVSTG